MVKMDNNGILNKEIVAELMQIRGECRGINLKNDADFVLKKKEKKD